MTNQFDNHQNNSNIQRPQRRGPCVGNVIEALFFNCRALMASDGVQPHGSVVEEGQDCADVSI